MTEVKSTPVFNHRPPEVYGSVTKAQQQNPNTEPGQPRKAEGSTTGNVSSPQSANEYDVIRDDGLRGGCASGKEEMGSGGGVVRGGAQRMETKNMMYEDNEIKAEYQHPSLARGDRQVYTGPVADDFREPKDSYVTCRCKTKDLLLAFFIIVAILLAVASLALSLLLWFGLNDGSDCTCPEDNQVEELRERISTLREQHTDLQTRLDVASNNSATHQDLSSNLFLLSTNIADINTTLLNLTNTEEVASTVTISNASLYDSCERKLVDYCNVTENQGAPSSCNTSYTPLVVEGTYLLDVFCAIFIEGREANTVITLLEESGGHVRCSCTRLFDEFARSQVQCRLYVTQCPESQDLGTLTLADLG